MNDTPELLPCPFCGGAAKWVDIESGDCGGGSVIECCACLACSPVEFGFKENLTSRWNTRAPDPRVAALVDALNDVADECTSDEIPEGYGPDMTESPEFHRGYDAALHRVRRALAIFRGDAKP